MRVHVTDLRSFRRCRRKYGYGKQGLRLADRTSTGALWFGTGIHRALAAFYRLDSDRRYSDTGLLTMVTEWTNYVAETASNVPADKQIKLTADNDLAVSMLAGYYEYADQNDGFEVLEVEKEYVLRVPGTRVDFVMTLDLLVEMPDGKLWVINHKTAKDMPNMAHLELDEQITAYLWILRENGVKVAGAMHNILRKKVPSEPKRLVKGGLSRAQDIDTTEEIYLAAINELGLDPTEYADVLERLRNNKFFHRETASRSQRMLTSHGDMIREQLRELFAKHTAMYPNPTQDCLRDCEYIPLCRCQNDGGDLDYLIDTMYVYEEPRK